jgi:hypothetical protein
MRTLIAGTSLLIGLSSSFAATISSGGVTGGGGNLLTTSSPSDPMSSTDVEFKVRRLGPAVIDFLSEKQSDFQNGKMPAGDLQTFAPIFEGQGDVRATLAPVKLNVPGDRSCFSSDGQEFDGSNQGTASAISVCISAQRIAPKVDQTTLLPQASALLVHEFSEILGATDEQAYALQRAALKQLQ